MGVIVSLDEWRRRRRAPDEREPGVGLADGDGGLGDEVVLQACSEVIAGRSVEVHRLAAAIVVSAGDTFL